MWGDPERASKLEPSDALYTLLLQITGPAHIPWNDPRWQELLHGYNVWIHVESCLVESACTSMAKHAATSSNLAALCLHVSRMLKDLEHSVEAPPPTDEEEDDFTRNIKLVGKARATAGALNLLRILLHHVLAVHPNSLDEVFIYKSRDITERNRADRPAGHDLLSALFSFLSSMHTSESNQQQQPWTKVPELYDTIHQSLQLILVMFSTQLYQPMVSSVQQRASSSSRNANYFLEMCMEEAQRRHLRSSLTYDSALGEPQPQQQRHDGWTPQSLLQTCLEWQLSRPTAPERSIAHHYSELAQSVVQTKEKRVGPDGMYESHLVVMAQKPKPEASPNTAIEPKSSSTLSTLGSAAYGRPPSRVILDATKGVLVLSSSLLMLPFRLMSLAFVLFYHSDRSHGYDQVRKEHLQQTTENRRTNDVLWLSDSPLADLGNMLLLLLIHNYRAKVGSDASEEANPFRVVLGELGDDRWDAGSPLLGSDPLASPDANGDDGQYDSFVNSQQQEALSKPLLEKDSAATMMSQKQHLSTNFESLFESFGDVLHTEVGALLLYTVLQSSPSFASFLVVRSDLDTLVMPLLRTLYFSSAMRHYSPHSVKSDSSSSTASTAVLVKSCPFRSPSQLYVILILLLLFSQDSSFGPDAFRRNIVASVPWYKERHLKEINLGSVLILTLLRSITFNLNRLQDAFLLSNCCAVLMNLSHTIVNLHEYAAMRLVSVTMSALKKYAMLAQKSNGSHQQQDEHDITTPIGMYAEVSHTLLRILRHCVGPKNIDSNLLLVYALVYHQAEFNAIASKKSCPIKKSELTAIQKVISTASTLIEEDGDARTAPKAMHVLEEHMDQLKEAAAGGTRADDSSDFTFTYEEETDPEIFFIPYVWEVIVCVVTASSIEWEKNKILVFPLLEEEAQEEEASAGATTGFASDVNDVV